MTLEKFLIMGLEMNVAPTGLALSRTAPLVQRQEVVTGMLKWSVLDWDEAEFLKIQREVDTFSRATTNLEIAKFVVKLADKLQELLPDRKFSLSLGSFCIEHKAKEAIES